MKHLPSHQTWMTSRNKLKTSTKTTDDCKIKLKENSAKTIQN